MNHRARQLRAFAASFTLAALVAVAGFTTHEVLTSNQHPAPAAAGTSPTPEVPAEVASANLAEAKPTSQVGSPNLGEPVPSKLDETKPATALATRKVAALGTAREPRPAAPAHRPPAPTGAPNTPTQPQDTTPTTDVQPTAHPAPSEQPTVLQPTTFTAPLHGDHTP